MPDKTKKPRHLPKVLERDQIKRILAVPNVKCPTGLRNRVILEVMHGSGLRVSEICNLTVPDVRLQEESYLYLQCAKGDKDRYAPVDDHAKEWLQKWAEVRPDSPYFFCTLKGDKLDVRYIRDMVYRVSEKAGVYIQKGDQKKKVNPHCLRHTCFTEMAEEGFPIHEIKELAGHASISTTSIYLSVRPKSLAVKMKNRRRDID
jgi:site-specific recombinase XerD